MSTLNIDKEVILSLTDLSKSIVPLFAAMTASYLTYRFSKKDKIRDHLFSYKVKSYSALAEGILQTKKDLISLRNDLNFNLKNDDSLIKARKVLSNFNKLSSENILFISESTKRELFQVELLILEAYEIAIKGQDDFENLPKDELIKKCDLAFMECEKLIKCLQDDLEIYRLNTNKRTRQF